MQQFIQYTNLPHHELNITIPVRPIFNEVSEIKLRSLYAVLLGCDVTLNNFITCKLLEEKISENYNTSIALDDYVDIVIQKCFDN